MAFKAQWPKKKKFVSIHVHMYIVARFCVGFGSLNPTFLSLR